jgi:hypothetical protein
MVPVLVNPQRQFFGILFFQEAHLSEGISVSISGVTEFQF